VKKLVRKQGSQIEVTVYIDGIFEHHRLTQGGEVQENNTLRVMDSKSQIASIRVGSPFPDDQTPPIKYQLDDHLSSSNVLLDDGGVFISREEYTPYGETSFGSFARKRYRFTGKERDEESGLYYHGARYYAPWLGRWLSCDPVGIADSINLYQYAHQDPLRFIDLTGNQSEETEEKKAPATQPSTTALRLPDVVAPDTRQSFLVTKLGTVENMQFICNHLCTNSLLLVVTQGDELLVGNETFKNGMSISLYGPGAGRADFVQLVSNQMSVWKGGAETMLTGQVPLHSLQGKSVEFSTDISPKFYVDAMYPSSNSYLSGRPHLRTPDSLSMFDAPSVQGLAKLILGSKPDLDSVTGHKEFETFIYPAGDEATHRLRWSFSAEHSRIGDITTYKFQGAEMLNVWEKTQIPVFLSKDVNVPRLNLTP